MKTSKTLAVLGLLATTLGATTVRAQSYNLNPLWSIAPMSAGYEWVATNNVQRGMAFNPATGHLLTVSRHPATNAAVYVLDANNGAFLGNLSTNHVFPDINFPLNMIGVAADGTIYACNLTTDSTNLPINNTGPFRIYRWATEAADPTVAYMGDPSNIDTNASNRRFGDSLAVRGSGLGTEILAGSRSGKLVIRFTTADGTNFSAQKIEAPELTGSPFLMAVSFGTGNTFWAKPESGSANNIALQQFTYDPIAGTATLARSFPETGLAGGPCCFDPSRNLLAIIRTLTNEFRLFKLTTAGFVQQDSTRSFPAAFVDGNNSGTVLFAGDRIFALESNNGILAFRLSTNQLENFKISVLAQTNGIAVSWPATNGFSYQPQYKDSLGDGAWTDLGPATNAANGEITVTDNPRPNDRFYRVRAQ